MLEGSAHLNTCLGASILFYLRKSLQLQSQNYLSTPRDDTAAATARSETCHKQGLVTNSSHLPLVLPGERPRARPSPGTPSRPRAPRSNGRREVTHDRRSRTGSAFRPGHRFFLIFCLPCPSRPWPRFPRSELKIILPPGRASCLSQTRWSGRTEGAGGAGRGKRGWERREARMAL